MRLDRPQVAQFDGGAHSTFEGGLVSLVKQPRRRPGPRPARGGRKAAPFVFSPLRRTCVRLQSGDVDADAMLFMGVWVIT